MEKPPAQEGITEKQSSQQIKDLLASHLEAQPENIQSFHRVLQVLERIAFGVLIIIFITALVLSFKWKSVPTVIIPGTWLLLPVGAVIIILFIAIHTIVLKAFPPAAYLLFSNVVPRFTYQGNPGDSSPEKRRKVKVGACSWWGWSWVVSLSSLTGRSGYPIGLC